MIKESKYCTDIMKKYFNKRLVMTKKDNQDFKSTTKYWIWNGDYVKSNVKIRDHCHITRNYTVHRDCNINVKLNHKVPIVFHNLKNYDSYLIMLKLGKLNFKINWIPNGFKKYTSFNIDNKLIFVANFQFLSFLLNS